MIFFNADTLLLIKEQNPEYFPEGVPVVAIAPKEQLWRESFEGNKNFSAYAPFIRRREDSWEIHQYNFLDIKNDNNFGKGYCIGTLIPYFYHL